MVWCVVLSLPCSTAAPHHCLHLPSLALIIAHSFFLTRTLIAAMKRHHSHEDDGSQPLQRSQPAPPTLALPYPPLLNALRLILPLFHALLSDDDAARLL